MRKDNIEYYKKRWVDKACKYAGEELLFFQPNILRKYFAWMFTIGYLFGRKQLGAEKKVEQIRNGKVVQIYHSATKAAARIGVCPSSITRAIQKNKKCKGNYYRYKNE